MAIPVTEETGGSAPSASAVLPPSFLCGDIIHKAYDGTTDDLLTGGLGHEGIQSINPPGFADPVAPTAQELRRRAIYDAYSGLVDRATGGGFGVYFGPVTTGDAHAAATDGRIAGDEFLSFAVSAGGAPNRVVIRFTRHLWCGAYRRRMGLKHRCAVAYTDKGTGIGAHDLEHDSVYLITGERVAAAQAGAASSFIAALSPQQRAQFNQAWPHRYAFKHAHSEVLPDQYWGDDVLRSIEFALYVLNDPSIGPAGRPVLRAANTLVIASSISNGGAASLLAAEKDTTGLIDAIVVVEPAIQPVPNRAFVLVQGNRKPLAEHSRSQLDYFSLQNVYQVCALLNPKVIVESPPANPLAPGVSPASPAGCKALHARGLLKSNSQAGQGAEAQRIINDYGILEEQNSLEPLHSLSLVPLALTVNQANCYGRFSVRDNLAGYSYAAVDADGRPAPLANPVAAQLFSLATGIPLTPPLVGVTVINNEAPGGGLSDPISTPDQNLDGAIRLRRLVTGLPEGGPPLTHEEREWHKRIQDGINLVRAKGNLRGKPAIIVHGRSDAVIAPNHSSRGYYGLNKVIEGEDSALHYYEVLFAQHTDVVNALPGGCRARRAPKPLGLNRLRRASRRNYDNLCSRSAIGPRRWPAS